MKLSDKIISLRKANGMTQEELASLCNVSRQSVSKWEADIALPETEKLLLLGELFHVSMDVLLKDDLMINGIKEEHSCSSNAVREKIFTSARRDFPELVSKVMISDPENGGNWFVDFKSGNTKLLYFERKS